MLTADLVRARKRDGELRLSKLDKKARLRALEIAEALLTTTREHVGKTRSELKAALVEVPVEARDRKLADGLGKLVEDASSYESQPEIEPVELRREVFLRASAARRASARTAGPVPAEGSLWRESAPLDRAALLEAVAKERGTSADAIERNLYADLRGAQVLESIEALSAEGLVARYETAQAQAVLLRAVGVVADVTCSSPAAYRSLFRKLKFRRLLHRIERRDEGYRITIDGPFSLFESVTKYGLALALVLPALEECDTLCLEADVRWGKTREPLKFRLERKAKSDVVASAARLPDELAALVEALSKLDSDWTVKPSSEVLELPGIGLCVPDLRFDRPDDDAPVYLELMGYWSRDAVWKRIELAEAGLPHRILFAASQRLRVSEELLDDVEHAALYVFKGTLSAKAVLARVERLSAPARG